MVRQSDWGAKMTRVNWTFIGAISAFIAVAAGAFGAHALKGVAEPADLAAFDTGARYHLIHALALIVIGQRAGGKLVFVAGCAFLIGTMLFAGSLYVLGATGSRALVLLTPLGGLAFLIGWLAVGIDAYRTGIISK
jgi:uncharacterized membrane protein YgdD (TMEM256/DUF423 family)